MRKVTVLLGMLALLAVVVVPAQATVMYTFTGNDIAGTPTLTGTLLLDDGTPFVVSSFDAGPPLGTLLSATLPPSPLSTIAGTFNGIAFTGFASLQIVNGPLDSDTPFGQWIVRSNIASPDGSLLNLNLFMNSTPGIVAISLTPPTPCCFVGPGSDIFNRSYAMVFSDGTFASGVLSLTVPEPPTGLLVAIAGTLLAFVMRQARRSSHAALIRRSLKEDFPPASAVVTP
jgi:hypothetical protein